MLRHLSKKALIFLTHIFNHLLLKSYFPSTWKRANGNSNPKTQINHPLTPPHTDLSAY